MHTAYFPNTVKGSGEKAQGYGHPSQVLRVNEAVRKGIRRRMCARTQGERTEDKGEGHTLLKELRSNTRKASAKGDARGITKKTEADATKQK